MITNIHFNFGRKCDLHSVGLRHLCEISMSSAVDVTDTDDMAPSCQTLQYQGSGRRAGGESQCMFGVLDRRYGLFEVVTIRIGRAAVLVLSYRLANSCLGECCREIDSMTAPVTGSWGEPA